MIRLGRAEIAVFPKRPAEGVLWWSFYEREAQFAAFLMKLGLRRGGSVDPRNIPSSYDKVRSLLSLLQQKRLLLVLDGFERELRAYAGLHAAYQGDAVDEGRSGRFSLLH